VAVGDVLPHDTVNLRARVGDTYDYTRLLGEVSRYLSAGELTFCNQEAPSGGEKLGIAGYPEFNAPLEFPRDLAKVGCNLISLANNHAADRGQRGIDATIDAWEALASLGVTGANRSEAEQLEPTYFDVGGTTFAFVAFTELSNRPVAPYSVNMFGASLVERLVSKAARHAEFVIASAHWGIEDSTIVTPSQRRWAQALADCGADLIIGTGPHVLQPVQILESADGRAVPVWYSLGNFLSSSLTVEELIGGIAVMDLVPPADNGLATTRLRFLPTYVHYEWTEDQAAAGDLLSRTSLHVCPLADAADRLSRSIWSTSVSEQLDRVENVLNELTEVEIIEPSVY
jgi:poly-gamma-glutamate synthesis protein (capsule biosynthesis protein)